MDSSLCQRLEMMYRSIHPEDRSDVFLPPASAEEISQFESETGITLPATLRQAYETHNGVRDWKASVLLLGEFVWLPLISRDADNVLSIWQWQREEEAAVKADSCFSEIQPDLDAAVLANHEPVWQRFVDSTRLPVAKCVTGQMLFVDTDPPPAGRVGQLLYVDGVADPVAVLIADSLQAAYLKVVSAFESGAIFYDAGKYGWHGRDTQSLLYAEDIPRLAV